MDIDTWLARLSAELGIDRALDDDAVHTLLDVARDAAHEVERPAAPLSTFLVGVAVGRGQSLGAAAAAATALARSVNRPEPETDPSTDGHPDPAT